MSAEPRHPPSGPPRAGSSRAPSPGAAAGPPRPRPDGEAAHGGAAHGGTTTGEAAAAEARRLAGLRRATAGAVRGAGRAGRATGRGGRGAWRGMRRLTHARGAGESGLARVIELHLVASLADTLIVTALATTIFFAVPTGEARGRVATSLLVTMVPFIVLAPVIGPLLDRVRRGRRYALATTMVVRAFLAWVMAGSIGGAGGSDAAFALYPAAFGFLVCQKAYIVTRAAALPRVLPHGTGLVAANSRISLAGVAALGVGGGIGGGLTAWVGPAWTLRLAFAVFAAGTALALALPARIDSDAGEVEARISSTPQRGESGGRSAGDPLIARLARLARGDRPPDPATAGATVTAGDGDAGESPGRRPRWSIGPVVVLGLRANAAVRAFTGFLTLFLAFRLRTEPLDGFSDSTSVILVVVLAGVGGGIGNGLGAALRRIRPEVAVVLVLVVTAAGAAWAAVGYGPWAVGAVALIAGTAQALGKLCLDALIQREVPERVRTSAFARSETVLQLAWVIGGGVGTALPLSGPWGLGLAAVATIAAAVLTALPMIRRRRAAAESAAGARARARTEAGE
jgi:MFS family permease